MAHQLPATKPETPTPPQPASAPALDPVPIPSVATQRTRHVSSRSRVQGVLSNQSVQDVNMAASVSDGGVDDVDDVESDLDTSTMDDSTVEDGDDSVKNGNIDEDGGEGCLKNGQANDEPGDDKFDEKHEKKSKKGSDHKTSQKSSNVSNPSDSPTVQVPSHITTTLSNETYTNFIKFLLHAGKQVHRSSAALSKEIKEPGGNQELNLGQLVDHILSFNFEDRARKSTTHRKPTPLQRAWTDDEKDKLRDLKEKTPPLTDEEIAKKLNRSKGAVTQQWRKQKQTSSSN
ncbi:hypothetical protein F5Y03DRAFT_403226 [Xylaria venustula]|nr:hypothetical protein F5Y03DRAFT_403226 [Xylaria venustula]